MQRIRELLNRYKEARISEEELKELEAEDNSGTLTVPALIALMEQEGQEVQSLSYDAARFDPLFEKVLKVYRPPLEQGQPSAPKIRFMQWAGWLRYAAAILLVAGVSGYLFLHKDRSETNTADESQVVRLEQAPLIVPGGNKAVLTLANGETIVLNSASSLRYPVSFSGSTREVELSGEAYFEIAANKKMPLLVKTPAVTVDVLGTSFNIMAYSNEKSINTTLVEGAVKVTEAGATVMLKPGQQANAKNINTKDPNARTNGESNIEVVQANMKEALAWTEGEFRFRRSPVENIMRQIERWYDVEVEYSRFVPHVH